MGAGMAAMYHHLSSLHHSFTAPALIGAIVWSCACLILAFHRQGLQLVGTSMVLGGFLGIFVSSNVILSFILIVAGAVIHLFGRLLFHLRNR